MQLDKQQLSQSLESLISSTPQNPPLCAILDVLMIINWTSHVFTTFKIPTVGFFTSGACSAALELAAWKSAPIDPNFGDLCLLPGLPQHMALTPSDLKRRPGPGPGPGPVPPPHGGGRMMGPPGPGEKPPWVDDAESSVALLINTCDDLERPYIEYIGKETGKPVWGVGPLLPEKYWESTGSVIRDGEIRSNQRTSNITENEVIQWLESKPEKSVIYISFGSELRPTEEEHVELAEALDKWGGCFIWVIQEDKHGSGCYDPRELDEKVKANGRGLIIKGWAPQLLILSHRSTAGFVSHCGWNSSVEAIGRGVPVVGWPIRGDQYYNAKLIGSDLRVGVMVSDDVSKMVKRDDIVNGINLVMGDEELKRRAAVIGTKFEHGFPVASSVGFDAFRDFISTTYA